MHECGRGLGNVNHVYDSDGYCWYREHRGDGGWSVERCEHIVYLQRAVDNHDCASNDCASNDCASNDCASNDYSSNYHCSEWPRECHLK